MPRNAQLAKERNRKLSDKPKAPEVPPVAPETPSPAAPEAQATETGSENK